MNTGTFAGYLGRDAETKSVGDSSVTNFSIGVSNFKSGEKSTLWVSCALWGERGVKLAQYLTKGSAVTVSGDVDVRGYSSKAGEPKVELTCNVQRVTLQGGGERAEKPATRPTPATSATVAADADFDEEIPFS